MWYTSVNSNQGVAMAAKKSKASGTFDIGDFVDEALSAAENEFGGIRCYVAAEHDERQVVMPIAPLCLQWLIESNGWPLGRCTQSGGKYGTHKSSFIFQLIAWYLDAGGFVALVDTEYKTSGSLMRSIIPACYFDKDDPRHRRFLLLNATTINEWQKLLIDQYTRLKALVDKTKKKPSFPILWVVDSMMGAGSAEGLDHIRSEGEAPGRTFSDAPLLINQYMKSFPNTLLGWPITMHMSHHEKPALGSNGVTRQGGHAPDFYATLDIQFKRGGVTAMGKSMEYTRQNLWAKNMKLEIRKSSMGSDVGKVLPVSFCWKFDEDDVQVSWWDWDAATAMLLAAHATKLKDILDINHTMVKIAGEKFWSDTLGISKENSVTAAEFGKIIEKSELRPAIAKALHIYQHPVFTGDMDIL